MLTLNPVSAATAVERSLSHVHVNRYYNPAVGTEVSKLGFYALISHPNHSLTWWRGGVEFVYTPESPEYAAKVDALRRGVLFTLEAVGFAFPYGVIKINEVDLRVVFSGVIKYERYLFVDGRAGEIRIQWSVGKPLTITAKVMATVFADDVGQYTSAEWQFIRETKYVSRAVPPVASFNAVLGSVYRILMIPIDGEEAPQTMSNRYGQPMPDIYFGIGPVPWTVEPSELEAGFEIRNNPLYFTRAPLYRVVSTGLGIALYKYDWFWGALSQVPTIPYSV